MKMDMSAKPESESEIPPAEGQYSQEQLAEMLESFVAAKKIEADPVLYGLIKDYAMSKHKMVEGFFDTGEGSTLGEKEKPKSLADLKKLANNPKK